MQSGRGHYKSPEHSGQITPFKEANCQWSRWRDALENDRGSSRAETTGVELCKDSVFIEPSSESLQLGNSYKFSFLGDSIYYTFQVFERAPQSPHCASRVPCALLRISSSISIPSVETIVPDAQQPCFAWKRMKEVCSSLADMDSVP
jgi:hypothetical protein